MSAAGWAEGGNRSRRLDKLGGGCIKSGEQYDCPVRYDRRGSRRTRKGGSPGVSVTEQVDKHVIDFGLLSEGSSDSETGETDAERGAGLFNRLGESAASGRNIAGTGVNGKKRQSRNILPST